MPSQPSSTKKTETASSTAGITTDEHGQRHIPSSVRADGSVRKEIRIKPGYRPPEDVEVYKNRTAEAWKNRGKGGVPGADVVVDEMQTSSGTTASKNAKRREARKKAAANANEETDALTSATTQDIAESKSNAQTAVETVDPEIEKEKQVKKLAKKLRQARELKDKKDSGSALLPEQFEKVIRINELIRQLDLLGFDTEGEKKIEATP